jgi:UDP-perosamine 4-acetyltransferase
VLGAGGHAKVVVEALLTMGHIVTGLVAPGREGTWLLDVPLLGNDDVLPRLRAEGIADAALGVGDNRLRGLLAGRLLAFGFNLPCVLHSAAWISPSSVLGEGVVVLQKAALSADTKYGRAALINSGAIVEHDSDIGEAAHIAPGCVLGGNVRVGARTLVGIGSVVRPEIVIGSDVIVGAGSVVVSDVPTGSEVMGCPARPRARGTAFTELAT